MKDILAAGTQGFDGSWTVMAKNAMFGDHVETVPFETFDDVFKAVADREVDYGVVAIESNDPRVGYIPDINGLLAEYAPQDLWIMGEYRLAVPMHLIGTPGSRARGLGHVARVFSQREALTQSSRFISNCLPGVSVEMKKDTALSVEHVMQEGNNRYAAIASEQAARVYGAEIIAGPVNNKRRPTTRFIALSPDYIENPLANKTSLLLQSDDKVGELVHALQCFSSEGVNLTRIDSHPVFEDGGEEDPMHKAFYVDFALGEQTKKAHTIMGRLRDLGYDVTVLGSYEAAA